MNRYGWQWRRLAFATLTAALTFQAADAQETTTTAAEVMKDVVDKGIATAPLEITRQENNRVLLEAADRPIDIVNPEAIKAPVNNLPAAAVLSIDQETKGVRLESYTLLATDRWEKLSAADKKRYSSVTQAHTALADTAREALSKDDAGESLRALSGSVKQATESVVAQYGRLSDVARANDRLLVEQYRLLKRTGKSLYGYGDDRYPPSAYASIFANRVASFALARPGEAKSKCSGTLISEDLALTNHHCISSYLPSDLEARFDYEVDVNGNSLPQRIFPVVQYLITEKADRGGLDFALLRLGAGSEGQAPGAVYPPACLAVTRVRPFDPVYLIGYPLGEPRTVHDNAYVLFPFRVTAEEYVELELVVRAEFLGTEDEQPQLTSFRNSYRQSSHDNQIVFENYSTRFGHQPTIGADFDSFHGNSGSPAFHRRTHRVVGLLFDGEEDLTEPMRPGWRAHEAILPMSEIIRRLDAAHPSWRSSTGVCLRN